MGKVSGAKVSGVKGVRAKGSGRGRGNGPAGSIVRRDGSGRAKVVKTGGYQWSDEAEEAFFDRLAATCNVRSSAREVGFTTFTVYRQRRLRADFAEKWRLALEQGYARLEIALLRAANDSIEGIEFDADQPIPPMTVEQAMNVLRGHRNTVHGDGRRGPGQRGGPPRLEDMRASIAAKVRAIIAARGEAGPEESGCGEGGCGESGRGAAGSAEGAACPERGSEGGE